MTAPCRHRADGAARPAATPVARVTRPATGAPIGDPAPAAQRPAAAARAPRDHSAGWLGTATAGLAVLAGAAAAVSFTAQYRMVYAARRLPAIAGLEAAIPDAAALIFASLGIALALHGRRAVKTRLLNVASVATSVAMNTLAAAPGWRSLAIWAMPPVAYALASDTLIGVVRAVATARHRQARSVHAGDAGDEATPLAMLGGLLLWLFRLALAPASTLRGLRGWVIDECPVAPGRRAACPAPAHLVPPAPAARAIGAPAHPVRLARDGTKTARFLRLVTERHGPLAGIPLPAVSRISAQTAPQAGLNAGAARTALRKAVLAAQDRSTS